ncbi:variable large family protein [Borrelia persica]|uniref:variable large family protein n=1 Tax=Borrelia persica TaxID=44448 RepID=UPI000464152E
MYQLVDASAVLSPCFTAASVYGVAELEKKNEFLQSLVSLGNDFIGVFTSFGDIVGSVLGLNLESKKSDVGKYFKKVQDTVQETKDKLEKIVADMKKEGNSNATGVESAVKTLVSETLNKIIEGAKTASEAIGDANDPVANVAVQNAGSVGIEINNLVKGIKSIVDVTLKDKGNPEAGDNKKASDGNTARTGGNAADGEAGKLFASANAGNAENAKKAAADASKAVGAVTGADILQSMIKDNGEAIKLAANNAGVAAVEANKKDATIAGGIALRAMAKSGKFSGPSDAASAEAKKAVEGAAISAVTKALDTLTIAIRNTIDSGLKTVKGAMKINLEDTPVITGDSTSINK